MVRLLLIVGVAAVLWVAAHRYFETQARLSAGRPPVIPTNDPRAYDLQRSKLLFVEAGNPIVGLCSFGPSAVVNSAPCGGLRKGLRLAGDQIAKRVPGAQQAIAIQLRGLSIAENAGQYVGDKVKDAGGWAWAETTGAAGDVAGVASGAVGDVYGLGKDAAGAVVSAGGSVVSHLNPLNW